MKKSQFMPLFFSFLTFSIFSAIAKPYQTMSINILSDGGIKASFVAKFALFFALLLFTTILVGKILKKIFQLPTVAGQIIGGVILGPSLINIRDLSYFAESLKFIDSTKKQIYHIASADLFFFFILLLSSAITVGYLLWIAGHETDIQDMAKVGMESSVAGFLAAIIPILMISGTAYYLFGSTYSLSSSIGLGVVLAATSVSIPIAMLVSQNKMNLRSSKATMGASIVDDILAIVLFSIFIILLQSNCFGKIDVIKSLEGSNGISSSLIYMLATFLIMFIIGYFIITPITKWLKNAKSSHLIPSFATISMLSFFSIAELIGGLAGITGAYFAGIFHRMGDKKHKAVRAISPFVNTVLLPIFLGSIGMQVNISILKLSDWAIVSIFLFMAIISKLIGCHLTTFISNIFIKDKTKKWTFLESYIFGSAMVARGEVGLVIATILNSTHLMTPTQYVICVTVIVLTTIAAPIMMSIGFKIQDEKDKLLDKIFSIQIGPFEYMSSRNIFDMISSSLELEEEINPIVNLSEGKKMLTLGDDVKVILAPEVGIIFEGNKAKIHKILDILTISLHQDLEKIPETL